MTEEIEKIVLSGDRPTGRLHLGHLVGSLKSRVELQKKYTQFVMIADVQALTDNAENPEKVRSNIVEVAMDNIAVGVDPKRTTFFIQSQIPHIAELTIFFLNLVTLSRLKRNPTVKDEMKQKGFGEDVPAGFLMYPVSQAADILFLRADYVPVGADQLPMIEQTNEIVRKFNAVYGETFKEVEPIMGDASRLVGIDGKAKMSKSLSNAIYLSDSARTVEEKVMQMYTDPAHIRKEDPGKVLGNTVFQYLDVFDPNKEELADLKKRYEVGGVGDVEVKKRLSLLLNDLLDPVRDLREKLNPKDVMEILNEGSKKAEGVGGRTLLYVKEKMGINYFN